jgi:Pentapeptide repeats (9 copies)
MLGMRQPKHPPEWSEWRAQHRATWTLPFHRLEWYLQWIAWALGNWALLEVLEYLGTFSVLIAVIFYFAESGKRTRMRHYTAWTVINTAQGKGGSGGRIEALEELNADHVALIGLDGSLAFLRGVQLPHAMLSRCSFEAADLRMSVFHDADLSFCNLHSANLRDTNFEHAKLSDADLSNADLHTANFGSADLSRTDLSNADLRNADLSKIRWDGIVSMHLANIYGARNAPDGFLGFALAHGAVSIASDEEWTKLQNSPHP